MASMKARINKDLSIMKSSPPPGVSCWPTDESDLTALTARVEGPPDTPYSAGIFILSVQFGMRYPFAPPSVRFITPVYHPNIDAQGRICLDTLKSKPMGSWSPAVSLSAMLTMIRCLLESPNPDDGLMPDVTEHYRRDLEGFENEARRRVGVEANEVMARRVTEKAENSVKQTVKRKEVDEEKKIDDDDDNNNNKKQKL
ncbi:hypothetical protein ScalyP_jg9323 [Parmales sp. scaly parma]|nr:hypothetical protein ScalyP_jg9323 [Parmales sp. scaly parma]